MFTFHLDRWCKPVSPGKRLLAALLLGTGISLSPIQADEPSRMVSMTPVENGTIISSEPIPNGTIIESETIFEPIAGRESDYGVMTPGPIGQTAGGGGSADDENDDLYDEENDAATAQPGSQMPAPLLNIPLKTSFANGFQLKSKNGKFVMEFHDLTQIDGRFYTPQNMTNVHDTFAIPRQWFIFNGKLSDPIEYYVAFAEGFDNLNVLDAFVNFKYDERFQVKVGRYKTPFTYEFYALPINGLINPERSLFFNNFGINRDLGVMLWGKWFDKRVDYAVGGFNGTRNGFLDANNAKDVMGYVSFRPWINDKCSSLENFAFGGSLDYGNQFSKPIPQTFRTSVATTGNQIIGVPFLALNNDVLEVGSRQLYSLHAAWYYNHLSLVSEWQSGFQNYALNSDPNNDFKIPIQSWYIQSGYFLTGEKVTGRGIVAPLRPFDLKKGQRGYGAWELALRYNYLNVGRDIFNNGLADQNIWTNEVSTVCVGANWYLNRFIKVALEWEHIEFGNDVMLGPQDVTTNANLFLGRMQLFF